jgi:LPS export ABC transporter protein LptC
VTRFFLLLIFFSCNNKNIINDFVIKENYAVESITNSTIKYTFNGKLKAIIKLGKMERFNDDQTIYLSEGVKLNFYKNNNLISTLTSEKAEIDEKNNLLKAIVNVTLSDTEGKKLKSSSLFWNRDNDEIYTNENVTIKTKDEIIYGSGFKSDSRFEKYYIKNVKGKFSLNTL